jgi:hypothetical protein
VTMGRRDALSERWSEAGIRHLTLSVEVAS